MKGKNNNKLSGNAKIGIFLGICSICLLLLGNRFLGIIGLIISGLDLIYDMTTNKTAKKKAKEKNELIEVVNNDSDYASDKDLITLFEDTLQSIKNDTPKNSSPVNIMERPNKFHEFASKAINKGAMVVLSTSSPISWHVFTNNTHSRITGSTSFISESPDIFPVGKFSTFLFQEAPVYSTTTYTTNASVGGRAAAGALVAGPVGAVVGAISAANTNNTGGVNKTSTRITDYIYSIQFMNEHVHKVYINNNALGEKDEELQDFLYNKKQIGNYDTFVIDLDLLGQDKLKELAKILTHIVEGLPQVK